MPEAQTKKKKEKKLFKNVAKENRKTHGTDVKV